MTVLECCSGCEQALSLNYRRRVLGSGLIITPIEAPIKPMAKACQLKPEHEKPNNRVSHEPPKP